MTQLTLLLFFCPFRPCPMEAYVGFVIGVVVGAAGYALYNKVTESKAEGS
jgi:hypothetical protein